MAILVHSENVRLECLRDLHSTCFLNKIDFETYKVGLQKLLDGSFDEWADREELKKHYEHNLSDQNRMASLFVKIDRMRTYLKYPSQFPQVSSYLNPQDVITSIKNAIRGEIRCLNFMSDGSKDQIIRSCHNRDYRLIDQKRKDSKEELDLPLKHGIPLDIEGFGFYKFNYPHLSHEERDLILKQQLEAFCHSLPPLRGTNSISFTFPLTALHREFSLPPAQRPSSIDIAYPNQNLTVRFI